MKNNNKELIDEKLSKLISKIFGLFKIKLQKNTEQLFIQIIKFVIVGGIATIIDWIVFVIACNYLNINHLIANILSYAIATIYNYNASVKYVFNTNNSKNKNSFLIFMIFSLMGLGLSEIILYVTINILNINKLIAKIISILIVMTFNFITRKLFLEKK